MKFHKKKLLTAVSAVALVLAVGACSSNGDDGVSAERDAALEDLKAAQAKVVSLTEELATANSNLETANSNLETATGRATELEILIGEEMDPAAESLRGMLGQANMNLDDANTALEMAMDNSADEMEIDRLTKAVTAAEGMRDNYMEMLTAANLELDGDGTTEGLRAKVTRLEGELKTANDRVAEIEKKAAENMAADIAEAASEKAAEVLKALGTLSGTLPTITVSASSGGTFTAEAANYTESSTTADAISGFRGKILTKDGSEAHVYTDIENAVATRISSLYRAASDPGKPARYSVLAVLAAEGDKDILWTQVKRDDAVVTVTGVEAAQVSTFTGSVDGLLGTFSCTGTCVPPTRNTNGSVAVGGNPGTWTFAPTNPNGTIDVADDDGYVQFGWWLNMKGDDVDDGFDVQTFATATGYGVFAEVRGDSAEVTGSATYTGGAAGKWAIASTTEDTTEGGHFTATATLGVDFDANTAAANVAANKDGVTVSGSITDFMTGATSRPSWKVTLTYDSDDSEPGVQPSDMLGSMIVGTSKWTTGGAVDGTGMWEAMFHGSEKDTGHPMAVDGTFNADIASGSVGRIQGAFGATK